MKDKIRIGLTEFILDEEPEECPGCVDGKCTCQDEEEEEKEE